VNHWSFSLLNDKKSNLMWESWQNNSNTLFFHSFEAIAKALLSLSLIPWSFKKFTSLFPSDFKSTFVWHLTAKVLSFKFYPKAVFLWVQVKDFTVHHFTFKTQWPTEPQRVGLRIRWRQRLTSLKLQRVNAAYCTCITRVYKSENSKLLCCILI